MITQTIIFFLALLFSYQTIELLVIDSINKNDANNNYRFITKLLAILFWSIFLYIS
jgi:hypothetical protein